MNVHVQQSARVDRFDPARAAFRTLLVHVQPEDDAQPRLGAAVALARRLEATLHGVAAEMIPAMAMSDPSGMLSAEYGPIIRTQIEANAKKAEKIFRRAAEGIETQWTSSIDPPVELIARLSRSADLIVAGGSPPGYRDGARWCDPAELVLQSGRPVLVVPPSGGELSANAIIVAWKDTREARRALSDSLPFLQSADEVLVLEVCSEQHFAEAEYRTFSVVEGLKRHNVSARAKVHVAHPDAVADELRAAAVGFGADLIVSGGYGHSRLGEWVFGGVTRDLLREPASFLLLSH